MITFFIFYILILGIVTSMLQICFRGSCAYCHILDIFKQIGLKKKDKNYWYYEQQIDGLSIPLDIRNFTFDNAIEFISQKNYWLGQLLSCPYCLSWHFTFWSLIFVNVAAFLIYSIIFPFWLDIIALFTIPYISNFLLQKLH